MCSTNVFKLLIFLFKKEASYICLIIIVFGLLFFLLSSQNFFIRETYWKCIFSRILNFYLKAAICICGKMWILVIWSMLANYQMTKNIWNGFYVNIFHWVLFFPMILETIEWSKFIYWWISSLFCCSFYDCNPSLILFLSLTYLRFWN